MPTKRPRRAPRPAPSWWGLFFHAPASATFLGDSIRGIRRAARRRGKRKAIDINTPGTTLDGIWIATHWLQALRHGFVDPLGSTPKTAKVTQLPYSVVKRFRARGGYRIWPVIVLLQAADRYGVRVELEIKHRATEEAIAELVKHPVFRRLLKRDLLVVKTLAAMPGALGRLEPFAELGVPTLLSFTGYRGTGIDWVRAGECVTFYRGRPRWS